MKVFIPLLNDGVPVLRPTDGVAVSQGIYRILAAPDYNADIEEWMFPPGTLVRCELEAHHGEKLLVAKEKVDRQGPRSKPNTSGLDI